MTREFPGGYTKSVQESEYKGKTGVGEVVGKVVKRRKSYNIEFPIGVIISHEEINYYYDSKCLNLTYHFFLQETIIKVSTSQVIRW